MDKGYKHEKNKIQFPEDEMVSEHKKMDNKGN